MILSGLLEAAAPLLAPAFVFRGAEVTWLEIVAFVLAIVAAGNWLARWEARW